MKYNDGPTSEEKALQRRNVSMEGNGNVVGNDNTVNITYMGVKIAIPSDEAITARRRALLTDFQHKVDGTDSRDGLLWTIHGADRLLVLGDTGSGKTIFLQQLALDLCSDSDLSVPVLISFSNYEGVPLARWIQAHLHETKYLTLDNVTSLVALLRESKFRYVFLFDELDRVRPKYRDKLVGELERWIKSYPSLPIVITSRTEDELWLRLQEEIDRVLRIQLVSGRQTRKYLVEDPVYSGASPNGILSTFFDQVRQFRFRWIIGLLVLLFAVWFNRDKLWPPPDGPTATITQEPTTTFITRRTETANLTPEPSPIGLPEIPPTQTDQGDSWIRPIDSTVMLYVPSGKFEMGSFEGQHDEKPVHVVLLDSFWIDRTEVTNSQFRQCVQDDVCSAPTECDKGEPTYPEGDKANHPVVCVNWESAKRYCEWVGGRLPTEAEWEYVARGTDGRRYPWGSSFDGSYLNWSGSSDRYT
jgi:hypothetical protein